MDHRDASVSNVMVVLDVRYSERTEDALGQLKTLGFEIVGVNDDEGVVEGTVETFRLTELEKLDCVDCVRVSFTYIADYPPGDPRDLDGEE
jgi:hypothetical protein